jgi:hypothetical protein
MRIRAAQLQATGLFLALMLAPITVQSADTRHSGTVLDVGRDALVVDALGLAGREHKLKIVVTPKTRIIDSERNPHAPSAQAAFTEHTIGLSDIREGDFVVVEVTPVGKNLEAQSVMVTLHGRGK